MNQQLQDLLRQGADTVERPQLDVNRLVAQAEHRMFRRRAAAVTAGALAVAAIATGGFVLRPDDQRPSPAPLVPTETANAPEPSPVLNGRIQGIEDYLGKVRPGCDGCEVTAGQFDPVTGTVLVVSYEDSDATSDVPLRLAGISVLGPQGPLAELSCGKTFDCRGRGPGVVSGPGPDELTFWAQDFGTADERPAAGQQLQVIDFNGTVRLTFDPTTGIPRRAHLIYATWSPDGSRLAVATREFTGTSWVYRIWLVDPDGDAPQLVHAASDTGANSQRTTERIVPVVWSPDGSRLGFFEEHGLRANRSNRELSVPTTTQIVSLLLPEPGQQEPGRKTTLREFDDWCNCGRRTFLWSPDGTRVAIIEPISDVNVSSRVLELSAENGTTLAHRPLVDYPLVWPVRPS